MTIIAAQQIMDTHPSHTRAAHDPAYRKGSAFTQGQFRPIDEAMVPIQDAGFIHADAAYDVVSASRGYIFRMQDHIDRFRASCAKFLLENPYSDQETEEILHKLVRLTGLQDAYIWWAVTRGQLVGDDRTKPEYVNQFYAFVTPYSFILNDKKRIRGANVHISETYERISSRAVDPTAKNFHWMDMKLSIFEALQADADWSVLSDGNGLLTEAPGSNIFLIKNRCIRTPAHGCLEGITRQTVLDLAAELSLQVDVGEVTVDELLNADEAFLTSTAGGIMPVARVNDSPLSGHNGPGELTTVLHNLYWEKRWQGWLGDRVDYSA